jgi:co-chaperonin GroES (HSP10)
MAPKLRPLHGFVQIEDIPLPTETKTAAGILIPVQKEARLRFGRVVALGQGLTKKNVPVVHDVKVGDLVAFDCYMGNQFNDKSYHQDGASRSWRVVSEDQIFGVIEGEPTIEEMMSMSVKSAHR